MNDNDGGNIIKFPDPDEYTGEASDASVVLRINILDDGSLNTWFSQSIETEEHIEYVKAMMGEAFASVYNFLNAVDDGFATIEGTLDDED